MALLLALPAAATASVSTHSVAKLVERRTAARFVSSARPHVAAHCHRRGSHRFKCHFAVHSGEDVFQGRVRVRLLHAGGVRLRWGELHLGGFGPAACTSHPAFTIADTPVAGIGTVPGTHVPAQSCRR
jgi:hypothetical protein